MTPIKKPRILTGALAIVVVVISGCRDSTPTDPTPGDPVGVQDTARPGPGDTMGLQEAAPAGPDETVSLEPSVEETGESPSLGIGSPAPPLSIAQWVTGEAIEGFSPGQVYVVEFWATWCPPCRTSMPHLSQLQAQYGDEVKFVGVTDETEETVKGFLEKEQSPDKTWAEIVQYRLAIDSENATGEAYMRAAGQSGIPTAFIVGRDAAVEWIGHPMAMDEPLAKIVAGDWDRQAAIDEFNRQQKVERLKRELVARLRAEEWDTVLDMLDQLERETGESQQLAGMRLFVLQKAGRTEEASKLLAGMVDQAWGSPTDLNGIAWNIATSNGDRNLDLALKAAQRASELQEHKDAATLDTLARVHYEKGQLDQAIEWQKKAVEHNQGNPSIAATLERYEAEKALLSGDATPPANADPAEADMTPPANDDPADADTTPPADDSPPDVDTTAPANDDPADADTTPPAGGEPANVDEK